MTNRAWLEAFKEKHGRPPRILHVGNICNNAFAIAKLLNEFGLDCDVICSDYFHIMGYPEWEEANIKGAVHDDFRPDWTQIEVSDFVRPRWFAQGNLNDCVNYLIYRRTGRRLLSWIYWQLLNIENKTLSKGSIKARVALFLYKCLLLKKRNAPRMLEDFWNKRVPELVKDFKNRFPNRKDQLSNSDLQPYLYNISLWKKLFSHYDLVHGYAWDPMYPLMVGFRPFVGYEHGTIRDIPFEDSTHGRLTYYGYSAANAVQLTNADSIPQAHEIHPNKDEIVYGLHGFDERLIHKRLDLKSGFVDRFGFSHEVKVFFSPARHHWKEGFNTWLKGNDKVIRAAAGLMDKTSQFRLVFVEWGKEVEESKALIGELGLEELVKWVKPLNKIELTQAFGSVDGIIDQFVLPCPGGVTIDAIAVGKAPVITLLDDKIMRDFFGETIPLFNCKTKEEIQRGMEVIVFEPEKASDIVKASKEWLEKYHSHKKVVEKNIETYRIAGL